ncbi:trypsin-like peptidase domain-containing protein [Candidatus Pelagibacter sp.]|nr:trypsin-like peptidase domain-containing protein [Candidatus Pelagibacter sp.]
MMFKKLLILFFLSLLTAPVMAETVAYKLKGNLESKGSEAIEVNKTPLIDNKEIAKSKEQLITIVKYANNQSNEVNEKNKNRKQQPKYKGGPEEIFEKYANSVVYIDNKKDKGSGSGFIVNHNGLKIITNWHVVETAKNVTICLKTKILNRVCDTDYYTGKVVKRNKQKDLAMIEVKGLPSNLKPVTYGSYKKVKIGESAFAIGHPDGLVWTFTNGMISQKRPEYRWRYKSSRHLANVIQMDVSINPGNSGGPLFNKNSKLIGVNTFTSEGENLNFAIAVDDLIEFINEVEQKDVESKYIQKKKKGNTWIQKKTDKNKKSGISKKYPNAKEVDLNENGITDTWLLDENKDGNYEKALFDINEDGIIEAIALDENENKNYEMIVFDDDLDGNPDRAEYDENDDGKMDVVAYDYNQDGEWDKFEELS